MVCQPRPCQRGAATAVRLWCGRLSCSPTIPAKPMTASEKITAKLFPLDAAAAQPLYRQIYDRMRGAIATGVLNPGDPIPSARALTKEVGLGCGRIDTAYSLLTAEGYVQSRGQAGTIVTPDLKASAPVASLPPQPHADAGASFRPDSILPFQ